jgi:hypothetical protein
MVFQHVRVFGPYGEQPWNTWNTPGVKQRSNALLSQDTLLIGPPHHECFHLGGGRHDA